ncbi:endonuclease MutS2 [Helicobacter mustelae]|uniref:Endonuclease MutS2 n=1 Tax=Helicobacter mustelae (strain ATCC 43772 / CCUG 25715 / CIP 103759 / LMG 18044 / NCTC 12198 / R85-136P) TaxID=679897 RepID=D3UIQ5_HELM1|nr:endonuclease MutS2 [Helicobacter mustelae]CBG40380.1 putative mismatch repair protein [Helicobacter mustelae 12198]SQH71879.1 mismatch repair protein [Helicobacter mustelae]
MQQSLLKVLDLQDFIDKLTALFARPKDFLLTGDRHLIFHYIEELDGLNFHAPSAVKNLDSALQILKKFGTLKLYEIFEFVKILRYFLYLKNQKEMQNTLHFSKYLQKIQIPAPILEICSYFHAHLQIKEGIFEELDSLEQSLKRQKKNMQQSLELLLQSAKIRPYLADTQIHFINQTQTLLLKPGFQHVLKGVVLQRSQNGYFYLLPDEIKAIYQKIQEIENLIEQTLYEICKKICITFNKHLSFLQFLNKEFDKIDHIQARIFFAKQYNLQFILPQYKDSQIILRDFAHPILTNPKHIQLDFNKQLLLITGVNAGGKTMLLKSILSAVFLAKHLIPFKINASHSKIPHFKNIFAIISDPQNSKNDISTFAGRMLDFSHILQEKEMILGIDEIELGTDADEAASLYKALLENLLQKGAKIIVTTHHKRLAAMMANDARIELCAAIYDEARQKPTFEFLHGSIGKSYAFETARRYKIPLNLIEEAQKNYGEDKEKLNILIEKSAQLEITLQQKIKECQAKILLYEKKEQALEDLKEEQKNAYAREKSKLENIYNQALKALKLELKEKQSQDIHRSINHANKILAQQKSIKQETPKTKAFTIHQRVKYKQAKGQILSLLKDRALIELDEGMRLKVPLALLKPLGKEPPELKTKTKIPLPKSGNVHLDLHGMRAEEAIERLDQFLSDCLLLGFDEILVYHGIGTGVLAKVVRDFLSTHPKVLHFEDAPTRLGGLGAKIIKL